MVLTECILLLLGVTDLVVAFQPANFHYWYLQSSVVVESWVYIVGGDIITDDSTIRFMGYTYSIDLSQSWTTSDVVPLSISDISLITHVKNPLLWYNTHDNEVNMWGGLTFDASELPGVYSFTPDGNGGVLWAPSTSPQTGGGNLTGLWGSAFTASPTAFFSIGGVATPNGDITPVKSMVVNTFATGTWSNTTSSDGYDSRLTFDSKIEFAPDFGHQGVLIALGGRVFQNQSSYNSDDIVLSGFSSIDIYDIDSKQWYSQHTVGEIPPAVSDFCTVGVKSDDGASYEIFMFGGATNDTYDTTNWNDAAYRDVYVLSLPAFAWVRADKPSEIRRRALTCQLVGNSQMLLIGGSFFANAQMTRVDPWPNGMEVFDLLTLEWKNGQYDHSAVAYQRAPAIRNVYESKVTPTWDSPTLATIFPFQESLLTAGNDSNTTTGQTGSSSTSTANEHDTKPNHTGAIVGGVVGAVAIIAMVVVGAYILRRRRRRLPEAQNTIPTKQPFEMHGEATPSRHEKDATTKAQLFYEIDTPQSTKAELPGDTNQAR